VPVIAVASARSSVGATRLAVELALAWHRSGEPALLVEADPDGGVLAARLGLAAAPNLTELAGRARSGIDATVLHGCAQPGPHGLPVVVAHAGPEQTAAALRAAGDRLADGLARSRSHVVVDVGRLRPSSPALPLADAADAALVLLRPQLDELTSLAARLALLPASTATGLVLVGAPAFSPADVERHLGVPVAAVIDGRSSRRRDPLVEAARHLAGRLQERLAPPTPAPGPTPAWPAPVPA
jgi:MinD-like ATPase involved in chromosome partitioning or flagellar assembly